jgi:hypothetical protein
VDRRLGPFPLEPPERQVLPAGLLVHQDRVSLAERSPPRVLTGEPDRDPLVQQRSEREGLGEREIHGVLLQRSTTSFHPPPELRV